MQNKIEIKKGDNRYRQSIVTMLQSEKLPVEDLPADLGNFLVAWNNDHVVATVGFEQYENSALLRSLVVGADYRNQHIADSLIRQLERNAADSGIRNIYLLTETAVSYFEKKGYEKISRESFPDTIKQSSEFKYTCPKTAVAMKKQII